MHSPRIHSSPEPETNESYRQQKFAMSLSLLVGFLMLAGKTYAYAITGSAAILSDAAESVVHVFAVSFAAFSLWFSMKPADQTHPYGHDKISFFSAGMEGTMIVLAAFYIIYESILKWIEGIPVQNLGMGTILVAAAGAINGVLGGYLVWQGKRNHSLILIANGKHVLTDSWTSLGVVLGLLLVMGTGWKPFDPILAIAVALNILWSGGKLIRQSVGGLMDEADPVLEHRLRSILDVETEKRGIWYHELKYRQSGTSVWMEFHLLFPKGSLLQDAHWKATEIEGVLKAGLPMTSHITTHLETREDHDEVHAKLNGSSH